MNIRFFSIFCFLLLVAAQDSFAARYALLIGCNNGGADMEPLRWAEADAQRFAVLLGDLGGFERSDVVTVPGADSAALEGELHKVNARLMSSKNRESDLFLFYYSGHADGKDMLLGKSRFPLKRLKDALDSFPSGIKIAIFDACQSGAITTYKGGKRAEPFYLKNPQKIKGQVIIASTSASEKAQESESLKGSIFTFFWLAGLRGSADASGDRRVTVDEAYRYAYRKTVETSTLTGGEAQHPMYRFTIHGEGDIALTDLTNRNGGILFDRTCEGKFLVLSDSYTDIFADFFKKKNTEWFVSLDPGLFRVINARDREVGMSDIEIDRNHGTVRFAQSMLVSQDLSESRIKGANPVARASLETPSTRPLSTHTWGVGTGVLWPVGKKAGDHEPSFLLDFTNLFYINKRCNLFLDLLYFTSGLNGGVDVGFDLLAGTGRSRFYAGGGAGLFHFENNSDESILPALTVHAGFTTDIGRQAQFALQVPYTMTFEQATMGQKIGIEVKLLFCGKYRGVEVLEY
jgi:hypothetical protein